MNNHSILGSNVKRGLLRFSERISKGLKRPEFKFVAQMLYGNIERAKLPNIEDRAGAE